MRAHRQAGDHKSTRPAFSQSQTPRSRRLTPGQPVAVVFFNPATKRVVFKFRLDWELFKRTRQAARRAHQSIGRFIQSAFLQKLAALEKELASRPHPVRKGGAR